jgi:hypothetical protein
MFDAGGIHDDFLFKSGVVVQINSATFRGFEGVVADDSNGDSVSVTLDSDGTTRKFSAKDLSLVRNSSILRMHLLSYISSYDGQLIHLFGGIVKAHKD